MKVIVYFIILGVLAVAIGAFFFRYGRNSAFINYIETQYGTYKAWRYIFIVITIGIALRIVADLPVDNPWVGE
ncbi:MAG: hypothetical protein IPG71_03250 [bacterium]|nr:hypothetical protein [bacterium]